MNSKSFHAHFFRDEAHRWCISVRLPDGSRTAPRPLSPVQTYELLPWLESLGIDYTHVVGHERGVERWIAQAFERLEIARARARTFKGCEVALWWLSVAAVVTGTLFAGLGMADTAMATFLAYFPLALFRDACARAAAHQHTSLRPTLPIQQEALE
jgi:hypothetical protein